jgi:hypothetical protein
MRPNGGRAKFPRPGRPRSAGARSPPTAGANPTIYTAPPKGGYDRDRRRDRAKNATTSPAKNLGPPMSIARGEPKCPIGDNSSAISHSSRRSVSSPRLSPVRCRNLPPLSVGVGSARACLRECQEAVQRVRRSPLMARFGATSPLLGVPAKVASTTLTDIQTTAAQPIFVPTIPPRFAIRALPLPLLRQHAAALARRLRWR